MAAKKAAPQTRGFIRLAFLDVFGFSDFSGIIVNKCLLFLFFLGRAKYIKKREADGPSEIPWGPKTEIQNRPSGAKSGPKIPVHPPPFALVTLTFFRP